MLNVRQVNPGHEHLCVCVCCVCVEVRLEPDGGGGGRRNLTGRGMEINAGGDTD